MATCMQKLGEKFKYEFKACVFTTDGTVFVANHAKFNLGTMY
jgi:hypothetical protein